MGVYVEPYSSVWCVEPIRARLVVASYEHNWKLVSSHDRLQCFDVDLLDHVCCCGVTGGLPKLSFEDLTLGASVWIR